MSIGTTIGEYLLIGVLVVIVGTIIFALSALVGGLLGYAIAVAYVEVFGWSIVFTKMQAALIGSIVGVAGGGSAVASSSD